MSELIVIVWFVFSLICFFVRMKDKKSTIQQLYNYTTSRNQKYILRCN